MSTRPARAPLPAKVRNQRYNAWFPAPLTALALLALGCTGCSMFGGDEVDDIAERTMHSAVQNDSVRGVSYDQPVREYVIDGDEPAGALDAISPDHLTDAVRDMAGYGLDHARAKNAFAEGDRLFREANAMGQSGDQLEKRRETFAQAAERFDFAAARWPDSVLEEDAMLMVGESWFFADEYPKAAQAFDRLVGKYPNTRHLDVASVRRFAIAQYWLELDKTDHLAMLRPNITDRSRPRFDTFGGAVKLYDQIRLEDPAGKLADDATMAAAGAYFGEEIYNRADHFYADLRKNFPSSKHQFDAHLLGMKCKIKLYQGADYNGEPLEQAETLIKRMYLQFPDRAQQEHEALQTALKGIRAKKAERLWRFAEYYAFRKEYAGARYYYQEIVKQFPQSNLSEKARKELLALGDEPDRSPDRMTWLSDAFPKPQRKRGALLSGTFIDEIFR